MPADESDAIGRAGITNADRTDGKHRQWDRRNRARDTTTPIAHLTPPAAARNARRTH